MKEFPGEGTEGKKPRGRKTDRPKTPDEIRQLVVLIAKDTGWGYTRILGGLEKLGIGGVTRRPCSTSSHFAAQSFCTGSVG